MTRHRNSDEKAEPYKILVSKKLIVLTLLLSTLVAFVLGILTRRQFMNHNENEYLKSLYSYAKNNILDITGAKKITGLPPQDRQQPIGSHVLAEFRNLDSDFFQSKRRMEDVIIDLAKQITTTSLLSSHCHHGTGGNSSVTSSSSLSCAFVLPTSRFIIHAWPHHGTMVLDFFLDGPNHPWKFIPVLESAFGVTSSTISSKNADGASILPPNDIRWSIKRRGFPSRESSVDQLCHQQYNAFLGSSQFSMKKYIASVETDLSDIQIYDAINPRVSSLEGYKRSLLGVDDSNNGQSPSYESQHPGLFQPDRLVYSDGVLASRKIGEAAYYEALVHPAMFAHEDPKRVAILGGGPGATLREVLKHNSINGVVMIEIDEGWEEISREYLPSWSDCSDLVGRADDCFRDPLVQIFYEDAMTWFLDRYYYNNTKNKNTKQEQELFDVIIMDAPYPGVDIGSHVAQAVLNALTDKGVFVAQIGEEVPLDAANEMNKKLKAASFQSNLKEVGFKTILQYGEKSHGGFDAVWNFAVALKSPSSKEYWHANEAEVNLRIRASALPTRSGRIPFRYFDGATMMSYKYPSRSVEEVFCRADPKPATCVSVHGFDPEKLNFPVSSFEVKLSTLPNSGRGVFAKENIPKGSYIAIDECVHNMHASDSVVKLMEEMYERTKGGMFDVVYFYTHGYGFSNPFYGNEATDVDPGITTFINHGCNGTFNVGSDPSLTEYSSEKDILKALYYDPFDPSLHRKVRAHDCAADITLRDIFAGEELFNNYVTFASGGEEMKDTIELRDICRELHVGLVTQYEDSQTQAEEISANDDYYTTKNVTVGVEQCIGEGEKI